MNTSLLARTGFASYQELAKWTEAQIPPESDKGHGHGEAGCINKANVYDLFEKEFSLSFSEALDLYKDLLSAGFLKDYYRNQLSGIGAVLDILFSLASNTGGADWVEQNYQCTVYSTPQISRG